MSDTVKLIIEIPKSPKNDHERWVLAHGIPLDDVKAEIEDLAEQYKEYRYANTYISLCMKAINKYIGKTESEDKE